MKLKVSLATRKKIVTVWLEEFTHLLHLPNVTPSEYHLIYYLHNSFNKKYFSSLEYYNRHLAQDLAENTKIFWEERIV